MSDALERANRAKKARREAAVGTMPQCTIPVQTAQDTGTVGRAAPGRPQRPCGASTIQNGAERERGVYWCPKHARYPWGSGGGRAGGGADKVPAEAWPQVGQP